MVEAYMDFEGKEKGYSMEKCESEVLRYLKRRALLSDGGVDWKDPQTAITFLLLGGLLAGIGSRLPELLSQ